jgi:hypothetical protein
MFPTEGSAIFILFSIHVCGADHDGSRHDRLRRKSIRFRWLTAGPRIRIASQ